MYKYQNIVNNAHNEYNAGYEYNTYNDYNRHNVQITIWKKKTHYKQYFLTKTNNRYKITRLQYKAIKQYKQCY